MVSCEVELTIYEGYSDQTGPRSASLGRVYDFDRVPVKGEYVETTEGGSNQSVDVVFWRLDGERSTVRLRSTYSCGEPFDEYLKSYTDVGWQIVTQHD